MREFLSNYFDFSDEEFEAFISIAKVKQFDKNEYLLQADRPVQKLFFVQSGFLRGYRIRNGNDITHHFYLDKWLATDYESFLTGNQGELYIQTITKTLVYEFNKTSLYQFYKTNSKFEKIRFIQAEDAYLRMVRRLKEFQNMELKARYLALVNKSPKLFDLVPQKHIASYLGVAPQSLSRIKNEIQASN